MLTTLNILAAIGGVLTLFLGILAIYDLSLSARIKTRVQSTLPIRLWKSLRYYQFELALRRIHTVLDEIRFVPDIVVGVHYHGLSMAALIAKLLYKPVVLASIVYVSDGDKHIFESLSFDFDPKEKLENKKVLVVDNSMITGATLRAVKEAIQEHTDEILTLVVYDKDRDHAPLIEPDVTLFASGRPKKLIR